jgi:hypothetical protein
MAQEIPKLDTILPYGETLRELISQSYISAADLKTLLAQKGIFVNQNQKNQIVPILMTCLLSPAEFDFLRDKQIKKEDTPKYNTYTLDWNSSTSKTLLQCLPSKYSLNEIDKTTYKKNYTIGGNPQFIVVNNNPNSIRLEYELTRNDKSKDWTNSTSKHKASIFIELKSTPKAKLKFTNTHTALETKEIGLKTINYLKKHFKDSNFVNKDVELNKIAFNSFVNEKRVSFFFSFTSDTISDSLKFKEITNVDVSPDNSRGSLPSDIHSFLDRINNLSLKGKELQEHLFIKEKKYHPYLSFSIMEIKYEFDFHYVKGSCTVEFSFPEFHRKADKASDFQVNINSVVLDKKYNHIPKSKVINDLNKNFEDYKLEQFDNFKE